MLSAFTFQYGQIYYKHFLWYSININRFTFQYGQIYYTAILILYRHWKKIYIPIWLDLLQRREKIYIKCLKIYIPIWLDLLYYRNYQNPHLDCHLHSNMVRFIILCIAGIDIFILQFTFQYGQIYYRQKIGYLKYYKKIYIPIWLDLLYE